MDRVCCTVKRGRHQCHSSCRGGLTVAGQKRAGTDPPEMCIECETDRSSDSEQECGPLSDPNLQKGLCHWRRDLLPNLKAASTPLPQARH